MNASSSLAQWHFHSERESESLVLPDGCRDVIVKHTDESGQTTFISELSHVSYTVVTSPGCYLQGIRLWPGTQIDEHAMYAWLSVNDAESLFESDQIDEFCYRSASLVEALDCLNSDVKSISAAANTLGVSTRSLQRVVKLETGKSPLFWLSLSRARKTARALIKEDNLNEVAYSAGFADQSHMNREMKRWFGFTPMQVKSNTEMHALLSEAGYG